MGAKINFIVKRSIGVAGVMFSVLSIVLSTWSWEELGVSGHNKVHILIAIALLSIVVSIIWTAINKRNEKWQQGNASIGVLYGDIIKIGFPKKKIQIWQKYCCYSS